MALPLYDGALDGVHGRFILDDVYTTLDRDESDRLNARLAEPMDVGEYLKTMPSIARQPVLLVRTAMQIALPDADLIMLLKMPTYWDGKNIIQFAAHKRHIGIYPGAEAMAHFKPRLYRYKTTKGAIQFPYKDFGDEQVKLISEIAKWCAAHNV